MVRRVEDRRGLASGRVHDDDGEVRRRRAGGPDLRERCKRVAQVGRDADVGEAEPARRDRPRLRSISTTVSVEPGEASRAAARASLPAWPAPSTQTLPPTEMRSRVCDAAAQTSNASSAFESGRSRGSSVQAARAQTYAVPRTSTCGDAGSRSVTSSRRSGVRVSDASVTTGVPISRRAGKGAAGRRRLAGQDAAGVRYGVVHLPPRGDDLQDARRHRVGVAPALSAIC